MDAGDPVAASARRSRAAMKLARACVMCKSPEALFLLCDEHRCLGVTSAGRRCVNSATDPELRLCGVHQRYGAERPEPER